VRDLTTKEYGPKVVDANVVTISAPLYRALKSFVYSSLKATYVWNTGVHLHRKFGEWSWEDVVAFRKTGKWTLRYVERVEQNPPSEPAKSEQYMVLETPRAFIKYNGVCVNVVDPVATITIDAFKNPVELERTFLAPDKDLPFSGPLSLVEVIEKMELYFEAARRHVEECARKEAAETALLGT
jgi:hypothetical protein